jgi:hypothetical protein
VNDIEELLRTAYHHAADAVAAEDLRPAPRAPTSPGGSHQRRGRLRFSKAAFAAAAVLLVAAAAALIPRFLPHDGGPAPADGRNQLLWRGAPPGPPPKFFAALPGNGQSIQFLSATSGAAMGHVSPPRGGDFFAGVAAEPGDRSFIVAVEQNSGGGCLAHLYQVRVDNAGEPGPLHRMSLAPLQGILPDRTMALSPDGSKLAYFAWNCHGSGQLVVTDLETGASTTWNGQQGESPQGVSLSTGGSAVSVNGWEFRGNTQGAKPGTLAIRLRPATEILHPPGDYAPLDSGAIVLNQSAEAALSPGGSILYVCRTEGGNDVLAAYAVAARKQLAVLARWPQASGSCVMAMAPSGGYLLLGNVEGHLAIFNNVAGRLATSSAAPVAGSGPMTW